MIPELDHYQRILSFEQSQRRRLGRARLVQYLINRRYYYGDNNEPDNVNQPLGIRYIPKLVNKHVHYLFGEWDKDILDWTVSPNDKDKESEYPVATQITRAIYRLMRRSAADEVIMRTALDGGIYGDSVLKLRYNRDLKGATFESVLPEYYHAMWHPLNVGETTEALVSYNLDRQTAYRLFGTIGNERYFQPLSFLDPGYATIWEHWTPYDYQVVVDDQLIQEAPNPYAPLDGGYGWIPFVHIPNLSVNGEYYGFGDAEPVLELQDELNMRIADFGDIINYHAHPITQVKNYFGRFDDLKIGPDIVWDMGREGEASYLEWGGTPPGVMDYLNLLMTIMFDTTSLPAVAFGRSEQSQASGSSLVAQMLPIVEVVRRKRATWSPKMKELATRLLQLESMSMSSDMFYSLYDFYPTDLERFDISPKWSPIMPRDRLQVVNENTALLVNKARSIITALQDLGVDDPEEERNRIMQDVREFAEIDLQMQTETMQAEAKVNKDLAEFEAQINDDQAPPVAGIAPGGKPDTTVNRVAAKISQPTLNRSGGKNSDSAQGGSNQDSNN
jgi:hypothetical protein